MIENFASWLANDSYYNDLYRIEENENGTYRLSFSYKDDYLTHIGSPYKAEKSDFENLIETVQYNKEVIAEGQSYDAHAQMENEYVAIDLIKEFFYDTVNPEDSIDEEDDMVSTEEDGKEEITDEENLDGMEAAIADAGLDGVIEDIGKGNGTEEAGVEASNEDAAVNESEDNPDSVEAGSAEEDWDDIGYDSHDSVD